MTSAMEEKFQIARSALPALVSLGLLLAVAGGCSSDGSTFGGGGSSGSPSNSGGSGSGQTMGGNGNPTQVVGGNGNPTNVSGGMGGNGTGGSGNPTGGSAGSPAAGGDGSLGGTGGSPPAETCPKPVTEADPNPICHEFFANDNAFNQINYVNEFDPSKNWTKPVGAPGSVNSPRQVEMVDNPAATNGKAIMVSVNTGYQEFDMLTGERLVDQTQLGLTGVRGAVRLANGDTILGVGDNKLRTVSSTGALGAECTLPGSGSDSLRVINRDPATGNFLLGRLLDVFIVNSQCQEQWTAKLPTGSKAYSVFPRAEGGVYATTGAPSTIVAFDNAGQIVGQPIGGKSEHPGLGLDFFSGFEILPNGNFVAANWQGHVTAPAQDTPHLVEFKPDNTLVWKWGNQDLARQITNTLMLR
jgi:hypothetical protein